ncbi:MAG: Glu-tRNA(Gln) amidotransferase GatDE subunit E, partial [Ignavibacteriales bacterium]|nr:Glu-tRNA(Gln) amidotransferase GatDE subunit E [Ignavibacteriales bacterium]
LKNKTVRLIQLSIEEDSCREISDIGHVRVYKTDRLGMPLIETVTYPDCENPYEVAEACNYIRFLNRSTGKVRTGIGAARQDVNVSCAGGTRVEIKGVSHIKWIPKLTHNEAFRQWALLSICKLLTDRVAKPAEWKLTWEFVDKKLIHVPMVPKRGKDKFKVIAVNLPHFHGVLSHFLQPGKMFADELADRIKVIACIEKPNLLHNEEIEPQFPEIQWNNVKTLLKAGDSDSQLIIWGPEADLVTAVETIEERCKMAFAGVPKETRKSFPDGTTIFERVLPGADRMYPDTDSAPIPLPDAYINELAKKLPPDVIEQYVQLREWQVPEDTYTFIFKKNLFPVIKKIVTELEISPKYIGSFFGHTVKNIDGHHAGAVEFNYYLVFELFKYLRDEKLGFALARKMLPVLYLHPKIDFNSILMGLNFKPTEKAEILTRIEFLKRVFNAHGRSKDPEAEANWLMGQVRKIAEGNVDLHELRQLL